MPDQLDDTDKVEIFYEDLDTPATPNLDFDAEPSFHEEVEPASGLAETDLPLLALDQDDPDRFSASLDPLDLE